jgi:hypothetical protein
MYGSKVLKEIFGPKEAEVSGQFGMLCNEELHDVYTSPSIVQIVKSRRLQWVGHVAKMEETRNAYRF